MTKSLTQMLLDERAKRVTKQQILKTLDLKTPSLKAVDTGYKAHLLRVQSYINRETRKLLEPPRREVIRMDSALEDFIQRAFDLIGPMVVEVLESGFFEAGVVRAGERVSAINFRKYDKGIYKGLGVNDLSTGLEQDIIDNWIKSNVNLITKTNANQVRALESLFRDKAYTGVRSKDLEAAIQKIFGGTRNNVALIARDQTHKLNSQLDRMKQTSAGIDGYYWRTSRDERVRSKHAEREGKFFKWDSPPDGGHPGEEYQCRCTAEPAVDRALMSRKEWKQEMSDRETENKQMRDEAVSKAKPTNKAERAKQKRTIAQASPEVVRKLEKSRRALERAGR